MMVGLDDVVVRYGEVTALDSVSLTVPAGQVSAVVGGDGAGKSTLLRTLVGRVAPDSGHVRAPDEARIGYQPARGGSWPDLTVAENMAFVAGMYGLSQGRALRRSERLLERAGLSEARDRLSSQLSGGMRTKLGFCLAMVHEPELLVLDEPSTGVDPVSRVELWRLLSETAAAGTAVLMATTYMEEGERSSHVTILEHGRILLEGPPADVVASSPGVVYTTRQPTRPEFSWRHADGFREWWPAPPPDANHPVDVDLEDVAIVAVLRSESGQGSR
jgi:ABC-2 type transport system ATP-binding protein